MNPRKLDHETWRDFQVHASIIEYFTPGGETIQRITYELTFDPST